MDVTPIIGILAIVGLVALFSAAVAGVVVVCRMAFLEEGEPFFEDERNQEKEPEK